MRASVLKRILLAGIRGCIAFSISMLTMMGLASQARVPGSVSLQAEKYNYNDIAYTLLSEILGRVTGTPYDDIMELEQPQPIELGLHYSSVQLRGDSGETELRKTTVINIRKPALLPDVSGHTRIGSMHLNAYARFQN
ncbi:serine hydrolase domain-containing protein [Pontibacter pamirensis]|uniref:serine hydrolase n=1 Tax=Pontibacter pamirensis TaxID=2562824 RepID=UPI001389CA0E|nr:serine hydrolase [Pontibacter pamirensis]